MQNLKMIDGNDKKGFITELIIFTIIGIVIIFFFAFWIYSMNQVGNILSDTSLDSSEANITQAYNATFNHVVVGYDGLRLISFCLLFAYIIATFICAWYVRTSKFMFIAYILIVILLIIVSFSISNSYTELLSDPTLGSQLQTFTMSNYVMQYLPYFVAVIGFIGITLCIVSRYASTGDEYG